MNEHLVFLDFGSIEIYWFGFFAGCAVLAASIIFCRLRKMQGEEYSDALDVILYALPAAFLFARVAYCWFRQASFSRGLKDFFCLTDGGYSLHGALVGLLFVILLRARFSGKSAVKMLDASVPALSFAIAIGRFAGITGFEGTGFEVSSHGSVPMPFLLWSDTDQAWVVWVGFFQGLIALLLTGMTLWLFYKKYQLHTNGLNEGCVTLCFMLTYGLSQALLESMRSDSLFMITLGFVRIDQIVSIVMAVVAIVLISVDYCKVCGLSSSIVMLWLICAMALTLAVVCEFSLNATYLGLLYLFMFVSLTTMWIIAAWMFNMTVKERLKTKSSVKNRCKQH